MLDGKMLNYNVSRFHYTYVLYSVYIILCMYVCTYVHILIIHTYIQCSTTCLVSMYIRISTLKGTPSLYSLSEVLTISTGWCTLHELGTE